MYQYRITRWSEEDENGNEVFVAQIQARDFLLWHNVTEVRDTDREYVENRAAEIIGILEYPNR